MKTIVVLSNHHAWTYNLRAEILERLIKEGYRVIVVVGYGKKVEDLKKMGCEFIDIPFDKRGKNPFHDFGLFIRYFKLLKKIEPDVVLSYTIKPNLYGALACRILRIPCIANITGLGTAVEYPGVLQKVLLSLYKISFKNIYQVFFQNTTNRDFLVKHKIVSDNYELLPGSGVNVTKFSPIKYPSDGTTDFIFISRVMKEKGTDEYLDAAIYLTKKYPNVKFHICGICDDEYEERINELHKQGIINYHGMVDDVRAYLSITHCTVLPTYYPEGMSNVLLESSAAARPIITTNRPGCREIVDDGINGFIVKEKDSLDLIEKMIKFIELPYEKKVSMGQAGRCKIVKQFNRQIVVDKYLTAINRLF